MDFGIASVAGITVICYLVAQVIKATALNNKWLPILCGAAGAVLGVVGLYVMPEFPAGGCGHCRGGGYCVWTGRYRGQSGV